MSGKFLPKQLKEHPDYIDYQDLIEVVLDPNKFYTKSEALSEINKVLSKEVD